MNKKPKTNRTYLSLWSLIAIAFVCFFSLSIVGNKTIAGIEIKTTGMYEELTHIPAEKTVTVVQEDIPVIATEPEPIIDTTSQRILLLGDSVLEGISPRLAAYAKENGHKLYTVIWYSSSSLQWAESDMIEKFIKKVKPTYIVMALGTNELFIRNIIERREKYVKAIIEKFNDIPFIWIGPPNWKKDTGINELLKMTVPEDKFFMSKGLKFRYYEDQIHPTRSSAAMWVDSIVRWMPKHCKHNIRLNVPTIKKATPDSLVHMVVRDE